MKKRKGYEVTAFKNKPIRILREGGRNGTWICLYDLCHILKRPMMMETREAMNLCSTSTRVIFKKGDKPLFGIHPYDVPKLVHLVKKESRYMEELCNELERWADTLSGNSKNLFTVDQSPPITFYYQDKFPISFKTGNGKVFINATEMAKSFGKSPAEWLRLVATSEIRQSLVSDGKSESFNCQIITLRGSNGATWIEECLALEYAEWLSTELYQWCIDKIRELIPQSHTCINNPEKNTAADEPDGIANQQMEVHNTFLVPQTYEEALKLTVYQQEQIEKLKNQAKENKYKVDFYEQFIENRDWFKSSTLADELQITTRALHQFLLEEKICKREGKQLKVHSRHSYLQCEAPYPWTNKVGKTYVMNRYIRWTPAGREYILELWRSKHPKTDEKK